MTEIDVALLRKTLEYADAHPEGIRLDVWAERTSCGTTACIAGTAAILAGHEIDWDTMSWRRQAYLTVAGEHIADVACKELGLTETQENQLFYCKTLDDVWEAAERITDGEIRRSP